MGSGSSSSRALREALERAQNRIGPCGRYHRRPMRLEDHYAPSGHILGEGYSGSVFSVTSRRTGETFAVKRFVLKGLTSAKRSELASEVEVFLCLDHPHVARLIDVYESEEAVSLVMECIGGGELLERLVQGGGQFTEEQAAEATRQMLLAVNYLHSEGVVHRDLKMENFLYEGEGSNYLKLIDFGFSKFFKDDQPMTDTLGTVGYMAPEVLEQRYSSGSCDIWSLGVIVFVLLAGYMPFTKRDDFATLHATRRGHYVMYEHEWKHVSRAGRRFVQQLLVMEPLKRLTAEQALAHPWIAQHRDLSTPRDPGVERCVVEALASFATVSRFQRVCLHIMAWSLTPKERQKLRGTFLAFDKSHAGVIRLDDVRDVLAYDMDVAPEDQSSIMQALEELDRDNDGSLHYSDYLAAMMATRVDAHEGALTETFRRFDLENAGYITCAGVDEVLGRHASMDGQTIFEKELNIGATSHLSLEQFRAYLHMGAVRARSFQDRLARGTDRSVGGSMRRVLSLPRQFSSRGQRKMLSYLAALARPVVWLCAARLVGARG